LLLLLLLLLLLCQLSLCQPLMHPQPAAQPRALAWQQLHRKLCCPPPRAALAVSQPAVIGGAPPELERLQAGGCRCGAGLASRLRPQCRPAAGAGQIPAAALCPCAQVDAALRGCCHREGAQGSVPMPPHSRVHHHLSPKAKKHQLTAAPRRWAVHHTTLPPL